MYRCFYMLVWIKNSISVNNIHIHYVAQIIADTEYSRNVYIHF